MGTSPNYLPCDGCGLPASPEHIAERVRRLELSTRFRPVHMGVLFVALAPPVRPEDDFYGAAGIEGILRSFLEALEISVSTDRPLRIGRPAADSQDLRNFSAGDISWRIFRNVRLPESEEPAAVNDRSPRSDADPANPIQLQAKTRLRRSVKNCLRLVDMLRVAGIGPILTLDQGLPLPTPRTGDREWMELFRRAVATAAPRENLSSGYDRIQVTSDGA